MLGFDSLYCWWTNQAGVYCMVCDKYYYVFSSHANRITPICSEACSQIYEEDYTNQLCQECGELFICKREEAQDFLCVSCKSKRKELREAFDKITN